MKSPTQTSKISIVFGDPSAGWIHFEIHVTENNQSQKIYCSDVFEPFTDLMDWLHKLADNNIPAEFEINEEECYKRLIIEPVISQDAEIEFRVEEDKWNEQRKAYESVHLIRCRLNCIQFLQEFTQSLNAWVDKKYDPIEFGYMSKKDFADGYGFDLREIIDIKKLKAKIRSA